MSASALCPGCPECHRFDRVTAWEGGKPRRDPQSRGHAYVWDRPNFVCSRCMTFFRFENGAYPPFRGTDSLGESGNTLFDGPLGPADAAGAFAKAKHRLAEARKADPGDDPFETFGNLKRAATWMMKGFLAARGRAPYRDWRNFLALEEFGFVADWDSWAVMHAFCDRVSALLYGKAADAGPNPRLCGEDSGLSKEELRCEAGAHLSEARMLLEHLRDDAPLSEQSLEAVLFPGPSPSRSGRSPDPLITSSDESQAMQSSDALEVARRALDDRGVELDFPVRGLVLAVLRIDGFQEDDRPLVVLRVPANGLWWDDGEPLATARNTDGAFVDIVLNWGSAFPLPAVGVWTEVIPVRHALEPAPEGLDAMARWLRELPPASSRGSADGGTPQGYRAVPPGPMRPRVRWLRRKHDFEPDEANYVYPREGIWPQFPDEPALAAFFDGESLAMPLEPPPPPPRFMLAELRPLDWNPWFEDDVFVRGRMWSDPEARLVYWSDIWIGETRRLGPTLCFEATGYAQVEK